MHVLLIKNIAAVAVLMTLFNVPTLYATNAQVQPKQPQASQYNDSDMQNALMQLMKYQFADPQRSLQIIEEFEPSVIQLKPVYQLSWHLSAISVFQALNLMHESAASLKKIAQLPSADGMRYRHSETLMYLGNYYLKNSHYQKAISAYVCSVNQVDNDTKAVPMIYSIAVSFRMIGDNDKTQEILKYLLRYLQVANVPKWTAMVEEALGILAMESGHYKLATLYLTKAMDKQQQAAARAKELNVILNLLLTFALHNQMEKYQRLAPRAERLSEILGDLEKHIYLEWIQAFAQHRLTGELSAEKVAYLQSRFGQLHNDIKRMAIRTRIAQRLNIAVPESSEPDPSKPDPSEPNNANLPPLSGLLAQFDCQPHDNALSFVDQYLSKIAIKTQSRYHQQRTTLPAL